MDTEIWKDVEGFEGRYQVSNLGRVKSTVFDWNERILKTGKINQNYKAVVLSKNRKRYLQLVHRLVAKHFVPNPDNKNVVNHIDENPANNAWWNLEFVTYKENLNYGTRNKRISSARKRMGGRHFGTAVDQFTKEGVFVQRWKSATFAAKCTEFNQSAIRRCCIGETSQHKGFIWKYAEEK